jgi:hypothetical protein
MSEYDADITLWSEQQGNLLRRRAGGELVNEADFDWANIAEEIESLGRSERSALASRVATIIEHLAKLEASSASEPRGGWIETVERSRAAVERLLEDSPSLHGSLDAIVSREHLRALRLVATSLAVYEETPRVEPGTIRYTTEQVMGPWLP